MDPAESLCPFVTTKEHAISRLSTEYNSTDSKSSVLEDLKDVHIVFLQCLPRSLLCQDHLSSITLPTQRVPC